MDFLRTCDTNAQAIPGFEAVSYQAFSVTPAAAADEDAWSPAEHVQAVEAHLRRQDRLVAPDVKKPWLWLLRPIAADGVSDKPEDLPAVEGYVLTREYAGTIKALDLARPAPPAPRPGSQGVPGAASLSPATPNQPEAISALYELLTSAVVALITQHLNEKCNAIALNFRTLLTRSPPCFDQLEGDTTSNRSPCCLTSINVYWASSGTLLVSTFTADEPTLHCLDEVTDQELQRAWTGKCVRMAPNGCLAQVVSFEATAKPDAASTGQRPPRKKVKTNPTEVNIEKWKVAVTRWLRWKGYSLRGLDQPTSWVRLRLAQPSNSASPDLATASPPRDIWWPRALCFYYDVLDQIPDSGPLLPATSNPLSWFVTAQSSGYIDPLDLAEHWYLGKAEREKAAEARRNAETAEKKVDKGKGPAQGTLLPSSPLNVRSGAAYGDLHVASGMYPTPPDAVVPGTATSQSNTPGVLAPVTNTVLAQSECHPSINVSAPPGTSEPVDTQPATSPDFRNESFDTDMNNRDDLFEDMDEDFGGNGVTDDDFNFFDDPEVEMRVAPSGRISTEVPETTNEKKSSTLSALASKENVLDPMAALESALASASASSSASRARLGQGPDVDMADAPPTSDLNRTAGDGLISSRDRKDLGPGPAIMKRALPSNVASETSLAHNTFTPGDIAKLSLTNHRESAFDPVEFDRRISLSDSKYRNGYFSFPDDKTSDAKSKSLSGPSTSATQFKASLLHSPSDRFAPTVVEHNGFPRFSALADDDSTDSASVSELSEDGEGADEGVGSVVNDAVSIAGSLSVGFIGPNTIGKRKLSTDGNRTPLSVTSYTESFSGDVSELAVIITDAGSISMLEPNPWDWSLIGMPAPKEARPGANRYKVPTFALTTNSLPNTPTSQPEQYFEPPDEKPLSRGDCIAVVQVVADQVVSATLDILNEGQSLTENTSRPAVGTSSITKSIFPKANDCNLAALAAISDVYPELPQQKGQQRPPPQPRRPNDGPAYLGSHMVSLQPPFIRIRRAESLWELLPTAMAFWETLGLGPVSSAKNISTLCVYPRSDALVSHLQRFLLNLKVSYEGCKLGSHDLLTSLSDYEGGLVSWAVNVPVSNRAAFRSIRDTCSALGRALAAQQSLNEMDNEEHKSDAIVIYMINPFDEPSALWELGAAFWSLFQAYGQGPSSRNGMPPRPDLVLQIIPIKYVASFDMPVFLEASTYANLAREVYDRCPPCAPSGEHFPLSIYAAPCFQLEEPPPRKIDFKIARDPPQDLLHENSYMHVGYAVSLDGNWVTAAWTDSCGKSRTVVSYHLGTRPFMEIAREIWQTTIEVCSARRVAWRICIVKSGAMDREELEAWHANLAWNQRVNFLLILLTVDDAPPFELSPAMLSSLSAQQGTAGGPSTSTPSATPQPGVSPDPNNLTPAATPAPGPGGSTEPATDDMTNDPDARLVDVTDESWAVILAHRLHNTNSTVEFRPALISGLLIKRGLTPQMSSSATAPSKLLPPTPDPEPGPIAIAVNIIFIGGAAVARPNPNTPSTPGASTPSPSPLSASSPYPNIPNIPNIPNLNSPSALTPTTEGLSSGPFSQSPLPQTPAPPERDRMALLWTPTVGARQTAETLLKEILIQYRGLGTLGRLKGIRGTRMGGLPWHVVVARRGVRGLGVCTPGTFG